MSQQTTEEIQLQSYRDKIAELQNEIKSLKQVVSNTKEHLIQARAEAAAYQETLADLHEKLVSK